MRPAVLWFTFVSYLLMVSPVVAQQARPVLQWGLNGYVNGQWLSSNVPVRVNMPDAIAASASSGQTVNFNMALTPDGRVWTWGNNSLGQLGDGMYVDRADPAAVPNLDHVIAIAAGGAHALALKDDGTLWSWGWNDAGQLGDGTRIDRSTPGQVAGITTVTHISANGKESIALTASGDVYTWGADFAGSLGVGGAPGGFSTVPLKVAALSNVKTISSTNGSVGAVLQDGSVWMWGYNANGQLGDGTQMDRSLPVNTGVTNAAAVTPGGDASAALLNGGTLAVFGAENHGMLGDGGGYGQDHFTPEVLTTIDHVTQISAGYVHMAALKSDGTVWVWGGNADYGQLGVGQPVGYATSVPVQVATVTGVTFVASGGESVIALGYLTSEADTTPPAISCAAAPAGWQSMNVSIACTASDSGSGLANAADSTFTLSTNVADGVATTSAATGSRSVCDVRGNCATAGPISGIMIDRKPPSISISAPSGIYTINQTVAVSVNCSDAGSGLATCNGSAFSTATPGAFSFTVTATDLAGNSATSTSDYTVAYGICPQYDSAKAVKSGSTIPIKVRLCDAGSINLSSSATAVHALSVVQLSSNATTDVQDPGNANPDNDFRFVGDAYMFNLKTTALTTGTYALRFTASGDPAVHSATFQVR